jgi:hypothetical protein
MIGHADVGQQEVEGAARFLQALQPVAAVHRRRDLVAVDLQPALEKGAQGLLVVHQEDAGHLSRSPEQVRLAVERDHADEGELAIGMGHVHAVADHEHVRAGEADEIGLHLTARLPAFSRSTAASTRAAPRAARRSLAKARVRPDSRMSSTSSTSRPRTSLSTSRRMATLPEDTVPLR